MTPEEYLAEKSVAIPCHNGVAEVATMHGAEQAVRMARKVVGVEIHPKEVYLCVLRHDDGTFKMIVGCFYDHDRAVKYAAGSPRIVIQKQRVI